MSIIHDFDSLFIHNHNHIHKFIIIIISNNLIISDLAITSFGEDSVQLFTSDTLKGGAKKPELVKVICLGKWFHVPTKNGEKMHKT